MFDTVSSDAQVHANRLNAQQSTGPRTCEGKTRSSRNSMKLGLFAKDLLIPGEDPQQFEQHKIDMIKSLNPANAIQLALVERIVAADWKLKRLLSAERELYENESTGPRAEWDRRITRARDDLKRFLQRTGRYQEDPNGSYAKRYPRAYEKHCAELAELQLAVEQAEQAPLEPPDPNAATVKLLLSGLKAGQSPLERMAKYQNQLENTINRCLNQLRQLKKETQDDEVSELTLSMVAPSESVTNENAKTNPIESQPLAGPEVGILPPLPLGEGWGEGASEDRTVSDSERTLTLTLSQRERGPETHL